MSNFGKCFITILAFYVLLAFLGIGCPIRFITGISCAGCCEVKEGEYEYTIYTSCCNATKGIFYYTTYDNRQITAVAMQKENLDSEQLICYPMKKQEQICYQN
jgi:choloylglycine hydrolase